jgi:cytidyltransferase-like protein
MKYSMFVGRWQPFHDGHKWLINQKLKQGKNVLICVRDMETDENNPWNANQVQQGIEYVYRNYDNVKVMIIPDIESINYGRDVGYEIIEHLPPDDIKEISATKIRNG